VGSRAGLDGCEKSRLRSPDRPASSELLYQLRYPRQSLSDYTRCITLLSYVKVGICAYMYDTVLAVITQSS